MPTLRDVVQVLDELYQPGWADEWDAVGTVVGDPEAEVREILLAVDPVQAVADEAVARGADLVLTHHPLYLRGVTSVAATTPKGRIVHTLASHGIALHTCHTNADSPPRGVSESMAFVLGLTEVRPLEPDTDPGLDVWVVHVPRDDADAVAAAMHAAGAGRIGDYDSAVFRSEGRGSFRPLEGAAPAIGAVGRVEHVEEARLELVAERGVREQVRAALLAAHPYEEVSYQLLVTEPRPTQRGSGRVGVLPTEMTLADFADHVAAALPEHGGATRVAGDLSRTVRNVALCGGSGDFLLARADAAGADVYVTSDLRHHPVSEHMERPGACAVVDVPHWAAEWTWLPVAAAALRDALGDTVNTHVSTLVTDPWSRSLAHAPRRTP